MNNISSDQIEQARLAVQRLGLDTDITVDADGISFADFTIQPVRVERVDVGIDGDAPRYVTVWACLERVIIPGGYMEPDDWETEELADAETVLGAIARCAEMNYQRKIDDVLETIRLSADAAENV